MKQHINSLQSNAIFTANQQHIWAKLAEKQKESLTKLAAEK